jgi:hypothetical protein
MSYRGRTFADKWVEDNTETRAEGPTTEEITSATEALLVAASAEGIRAEEIEAEFSDVNGFVAAGFSPRT